MFVVHASTAEELRQELLQELDRRYEGRMRQMKGSDLKVDRVANAARAGELAVFKTFLEHLHIEPKKEEVISG